MGITGVGTLISFVAGSSLGAGFALLMPNTAEECMTLMRPFRGRRRGLEDKTETDKDEMTIYKNKMELVLQAAFGGGLSLMGLYLFSPTILRDIWLISLKERPQVATKSSWFPARK